MKSICFVCHKRVKLSQLIFDKGCGIEQSSGEKSRPIFLYAEHPAREGFKSTMIVDQATGAIRKIICDGSWRPSKEV